MIKVGIVEDNVSLLKNLNIFLGNFPDIKIVFSYTDFAEFEQARRREKSLTPDIVLIDYNENSLKQQISILSRFLEIYPSVKVLVYTEFDDEDVIVESIMKGASGYLLKTNTLYDIYSAIKECCEHGGFVSSRAVLQMINYIQRRQSNISVHNELNVKQREIVHSLQQGLTYDEMSLQLGISRFTVNYHVQRIFRKMMVKSRIELIYKLNRTEEVLSKQY